MGRNRQIGGLAAILVIGAALVAPVRGAADVSTTQPPAVHPLRVCADPDNLPFSSKASGAPGLYIELGQQIAQALGRPFEAVWSISYFGKRTVRTTLLANTCDAYVGLPGGKGFMGPQLIFSKPFLQIGYAIMAPTGLHVTRLDDLAGKRVAVQFSTPPHLVLANRDDVHTVTFLNPDEAAGALARREVDVALIWGPTAGYINATALKGSYQVVPIAGEGMQWPVVIGFAKANTELRDQVNRALDQSGAALAGLATKYGLPTGAPIELASRDDRSSAVLTLVSTSDADPQPEKTEPSAMVHPAEPAAAPSQEAPPGAEPAGGDAATVADGRKIFNGTCSHCHGPNAVQADKHIDLRLLRHRYGETTEKVFHEVVTKGRPSKGMPNWSKVFSEDDFKKIYAYLNTVQSN